MVIRLKRAYDPATDEDGFRVLVDRLWPRGLSRSAARVDYWAKEVAPSPELRRWFGHDPHKWTEFRERYFAELDARQNAVAELLEKIDRSDVTFVYGARSRQNNARVLKDYLENRHRRDDERP